MTEELEAIIVIGIIFLGFLLGLMMIIRAFRK